MNQDQVLRHIRNNKNTAVVELEQMGSATELRLRGNTEAQLRLKIKAVGICNAKPIMIIDSFECPASLPMYVNVVDLGQVKTMKLAIMPTETLQSAIDYGNRRCSLAMRVTEVVEVEEQQEDQFQKMFEKTMATLAEVSEGQKEILASQKQMIADSSVLLNSMKEMLESEKAFQATMAEFLKTMEQ